MYNLIYIYKSKTNNQQPPMCPYYITISILKHTIKIYKHIKMILKKKNIKKINQINQIWFCVEVINEENWGLQRLFVIYVLQFQVLSNYSFVLDCDIIYIWLIIV